MRLKLIVVGKTNDRCLRELMEDYIKRIGRFINFEYLEVSEHKGKVKDLNILKQKEWDNVIRQLECDNIVLLDERGKQFSSVEFANWLENQLLSSKKCLIFVIGGAYGFPENVKNRYYKLSLSKMTFSHQIVRLIFLEQLYRAFTIIHSQPYHH